MHQRLLIIDTDLFVLLAAAGLVGRVAELLGFNVADVRRLPALPYQLRKGKNFKKKYSEDVLDAAVEQAGSIAPVTERPLNDALFQRLIDTDNIDSGEAEVIAVAVERGHIYLASGDKRWMRALVAAPNLADVRAALAGRVICTEIVLRLLVESDGVAAVASAFAAVREGNQTLRVVFSEAAATDQVQCLSYIRSYYTDLVRDVGDGFFFDP
jgi:hypothetical protein